MSSVAQTGVTREQTASLLARFDWVWAVCSLAAAVALTIAAFIPLWTMTLHAPQYPGGLHLDAYGTDMSGDLEEINTLNHYVGVKSIEPGEVLELKLFPFAISLVVAGLVLAAFLKPGRKLRWAMRAVLWSIPIGMLIDLQYWLYKYGHDLNPDAPVRVDPFTPRVIGSTNVIQFKTDTMVAAGFWLMVVAAVLLTLGPWVVRFITESWKNTGTAAAAALVVTAALGGSTLLAKPAQAETPTTPTTTIAAAIEAAEPGDTVVIPPGEYHEMVVVTKPLTLIGEGFPVIDGGGKGDVVRIEADDVTIRGFTIRHSASAVADEPAAIRAIGDRATIEDNRIEDVLYGIVLQESNQHVVRNNYISSMASFPSERRGHAVYLWYSDGTVVDGNRIDLAKDGLFLGFATNTTLTNNYVTHVRYGIHYMYANNNTFSGNVFRHSVAGAAIMYSSDVKLFDNEFSYNKSAASGYGILFKDVDNVEVRNNRIHHNRVGLTMEGTPRTPGTFATLRDNLIGYNHTALNMFTTTNVTFVGNTFAGNVQQVESNGGDLQKHNSWSLDGRGNYWDDYRGFDANGDGVGDIDYRYEGAFDDLVEREDALRAYSFTFARTALDLSARWFPAYRPTPRVVDPHPLMSPTVTLKQGASQETQFKWVGVGAALIAVPAGVFVLARRSFSVGWQPC